ncbi:MBL fold metallo-hydrolase [Rhizobium sp. BK376]|uniref:MBL fold metallo-hydrolase n=1 Tax=Rhizobium sp. BK376 TaxID=2512149 RepID=UPI001052AFDD|nr:MBL fold metallo-hydrolase [Rhizobium sp. BK376]TCR80097.1 Cft2 family RNA processing exonuclease [Rhizobium sp. BK376]
MKIEAISGYGGKTPACFLVEIEGKRFLLDLGEGPEAGVFPDLAKLGRIDAVLISHSHKDHIGALPLLDQIGSPPVYTTAMVREISAHSMLDVTRDLPLQGAIDILGVAVETGRASHAPGGIWMRIGGEGGVLYTGDWTRESELYGLDDFPRAAAAICDVSYGDHEEPLSIGIDRIAKEALSGPLLLPMPPAGRGLDSAVLLSEAGLRVGLCPAHRKIAERLAASGRGEVSATARQRLTGLLEKAATLHGDSSAEGVMIAAAADAGDGLAAKLAARFADNDAVRIIFTGHVADGTPGKALIEEGIAGFARWNVHPRASDIRWFADLVQPRVILPAFAGKPAMTRLAALYPDLSFSGPTIDI